MSKIDKILQWPWRAKKLGITQKELAKMVRGSQGKLQTLIRAAKLMSDENKREDKYIDKVESALKKMEQTDEQ